MNTGFALTRSVVVEDVVMTDAEAFVPSGSCGPVGLAGSMAVAAPFAAVPTPSGPAATPFGPTQPLTAFSFGAPTGPLVFNFNTTRPRK